MRRPLTPGETALAASVFGDAIDYAPVTIVRRKWAFFQPKRVVMAPCGHIHFHPAGDLWRDDFAAAPLDAQGLFIHEMVMCLPKCKNGLSRVSHEQRYNLRKVQHSYSGARR